MDIFSVLTLMGGLAFFLYGMTVLSSGLERMAGGKLEGALKRMTSNRIKGLLLGVGITAAIQSSSAVTVMLVGLVNSGIMTIGQSIGVIMGSNIGTTMTAWILTLVGIESDNVFMKLLKPENFSLAFAFAGVILIMISKKQRKRDVGSVLVGFAVLMYGMKLMSSAVKPLASSPAFARLFTAFENPLLGVLVGLLVTAVIQSSSASVGILQALALTGAVTAGAAIPIIMGQNIGTCVTALISSIGVTRSARKVAVVHVLFNLIGTAVCLTLYCIANAAFDLNFASVPIGAVGIAAVHSAFNIFTTAMLLPFAPWLERMANRVLGEDTAEREETRLLDERLLATPSLAISECDVLSVKMCKCAGRALLRAVSLLECYEEALAESVVEDENLTDRYEDELGSYLVRLSAKSLSDEDSVKVSRMLHTIGDFERMGDHAVNLLEAARELHDKGLKFSEAAQGELGVLRSALEEILKLTEETYETGDLEKAVKVEPLEQTVDRLTAAVKDRHIRRLQAGECSIELGFILSDVLSNLERVSDHCSNVAAAVIELSRSSFGVHKYLGAVRTDNERFREDFDGFMHRYTLS